MIFFFYSPISILSHSLSIFYNITNNHPYSILFSLHTLMMNYISYTPLYFFISNIFYFVVHLIAYCFSCCLFFCLFCPFIDMNNHPSLNIFDISSNYLNHYLYCYFVHYSENNMND